MPKKKYIVNLTNSERAERKQLTKKGKIPASKMNHGRISTYVKLIVYDDLYLVSKDKN